MGASLVCVSVTYSLVCVSVPRLAPSIVTVIRILIQCNYLC